LHAVTVGGGTDVEGDGGEAREVGQRARLGVEALEYHLGERERDVGWTRCEDTEQRPVRHLDTAEDRLRRNLRTAMTMVAMVAMAPTECRRSR
jgi:hypothetical protein